MTDDYPTSDRRHDWKIDEMYKTLGEIKPVVARIPEMDEKLARHEVALFGRFDELSNKFHGGIVSIVQNIPRWFSVIVLLLAVIVFVPADWRESLFKTLLGLVH